MDVSPWLDPLQAVPADEEQSDVESVESVATRDSGFGSVSSQRCDGVFGKEPSSGSEGKFKLRGKVVFVTYARSQVQDAHRFYEYLKSSLKAHLPVLNGRTGERGALNIYGSKELHEDGIPHYHVLIRFNPGVNWADGREKLRVWIDDPENPGNTVVDTESINIQVSKGPLEARAFMEDVQAYIGKGAVDQNDVFGEYMDFRHAAVSRDLQLRYDALLEEKTREGAEVLLRKWFPKEYIFHYGQLEAFLKMKERAPAVAYEPDFERRPFRIPARLAKWKREQFSPTRKGRPRCVVIVGRSRTGKTQWGMSFGRPAVMTTGWNVDALTQEGITHVVLNDINLDKFPNARDMAGCQDLITVTGKYRSERTIKFGKPVIWTCNEDNDVTKHPVLEQYLKDTKAVVVRLRNKRLFEED